MPWMKRAMNIARQNIEYEDEPTLSLLEAARIYMKDHCILRVLEQRTRLKRTGDTNGGEYHGACPLCGGDDRFMVWPKPQSGNPRSHCRHCKMTWDSLTWAMYFAGFVPTRKGAKLQFLKREGYYKR